MPNVDQDTGIRHPIEPDRSLRKYRNVDEGAKKKGCLGMQLTPLFDMTENTELARGAANRGEEGPETWIEVGMSVDVLARGEHFYIVQP